MPWALRAVDAYPQCVSPLFGRRATRDALADPAAGYRTTEVLRVLLAMHGAAILVNSDTREVLNASAQSYALGIVERGSVAISEIDHMVAEVARSGVATEAEITVRRTAIGKGRLELLVRVAPLEPDIAVVTAENLSGARRVDDVRRDFVANVSHELKTPIGALSLLAEAVLSAADEPDAVRHFASRMQVESDRLADLVGDLVDLSRLQGDDPMENAEPVNVDEVVNKAMDSTRNKAQLENIQLIRGGTRRLEVFGVESQLVTALKNLLSNAVSYSPSATRVAVATKLVGSAVEVSVTDQGIGIPSGEIDRIFERFYRVDQARSRVTGGTGLGLAIVKHVSRNHGGEVAVWSVEGEGSTFTLRLPRYVGPPPLSNGNCQDPRTSGESK